MDRPADANSTVDILIPSHHMIQQMIVYECYEKIQGPTMKMNYMPCC